MDKHISIIEKNAINTETSTGKPIIYVDVTAQEEGEEKVTFVAYQIGKEKLKYVRMEGSLIDMVETDWDWLVFNFKEVFTEKTFPADTVAKKCLRVLKELLKDISREAVTLTNGETVSISALSLRQEGVSVMFVDDSEPRETKTYQTHRYVASVGLVTDEKKITVKLGEDSQDHLFDITRESLVGDKDYEVWHACDHYFVLGTKYEVYSLYMLMCFKLMFEN